MQALPRHPDLSVGHLAIPMQYAYEYQGKVGDLLLTKKPVLVSFWLIFNPIIAPV
jgi:hypothetical protein